MHCDGGGAPVVWASVQTPFCRAPNLTRLGKFCKVHFANVIAFFEAVCVASRHFAPKIFLVLIA